MPGGPVRASRVRPPQVVLLPGVLLALLLACGTNTSAERVNVPAGASFGAVTDSLAAHGVVGNRFWFELLARLAKSDCLGREPGRFNCEAMDWFLERARALGVEHQPPPPLLLGRHLLALGLPPGPRVGEILKEVYEQQLDGKVTTVEEAIEEASKRVTR